MRTKREFRETHDYPCWCGQKEARVFCGQMLGRHHFLVLECRDCHTHRILPRALAEASSAETLYNEYQPPESSPSNQRHFLERMLPRLTEVGLEFSPKHKVLDVGCGTGQLLEAICAQSGCAGLGVDVDRRRIARAEAHAKHAKFKCELFSPASTPGKYNVVISSAVIEHVPDPVSFLQQFHAVLEDGGSLFLLTPNAASLNYCVVRSWWRDLLCIGEHIYLFTPESLERCAAQAGFKLVRSSSGFDWGTCNLQMNSVRNALITLWTVYRTFVRRVAAQVASRRNGDLLFAHFKKV